MVLGFPDEPGLWSFEGYSCRQAALPLWAGVFVPEGRWWNQRKNLRWGPGALGSSPSSSPYSLGNLGKSLTVSEDQAMRLALLGRGRYVRHTKRGSGN